MWCFHLQYCCSLEEDFFFVFFTLCKHLTLKSPWRSAVSDIQTTLSHTNKHTLFKVTQINCFLFRCSKLKLTEALYLYLHDFMHYNSDHFDSCKIAVTQNTMCSGVCNCHLDRVQCCLLRLSQQYKICQIFTHFVQELWYFTPDYIRTDYHSKLQQKCSLHLAKKRGCANKHELPSLSVMVNREYSDFINVK